MFAQNRPHVIVVRDLGSRRLIGHRPIGPGQSQHQGGSHQQGVSHDHHHVAVSGHRVRVSPAGYRPPGRTSTFPRRPLREAASLVIENKFARVQDGPEHILQPLFRILRLLDYLHQSQQLVGSRLASQRSHVDRLNDLLRCLPGRQHPTDHATFRDLARDGGAVEHVQGLGETGIRAHLGRDTPYRVARVRRSSGSRSTSGHRRSARPARPTASRGTSPSSRSPGKCSRAASRRECDAHVGVGEVPFIHLIRRVTYRTPLIGVRIADVAHQLPEIEVVVPQPFAQLVEQGRIARRIADPNVVHRFHDRPAQKSAPRHDWPHWWQTADCRPMSTTRPSPLDGPYPTCRAADRRGTWGASPDP